MDGLKLCLTGDPLHWTTKEPSSILYIKGHPNSITGSRVAAILLNGWILPIGEASAVGSAINWTVQNYGCGL